jgi:3-phenylpropionate/trans-cinnamate dioxygenase ferredoxin component
MTPKRVTHIKGAFMSGPDYAAVANVSNVPSGSTKLVEVGGKIILLCNDDERIYAVSPYCSHADEPLACGQIKHSWIACPAPASGSIWKPVRR